MNKSRELALKARITSLECVHKSKSSHIGSALSIIDLMAVLYTEIMTHDSKNPLLDTRDHFILSKGHACIGLYAILGHLDYFPLSDLDTYAKNGSVYMSHVSHKVNGVEFSTGSLGHGVGFGTGIALSKKIRKTNEQVYVLCGDGELGEGSNWEAFLFASHNNLDNLTIIIDHNNLQSLTTVEETMSLKPFKAKFESFGLNYFEVDGHNHIDLKETLLTIKQNKNGQPSVLLMNTVKGKGVTYMENKVEWHYKSPDESQLFKALEELRK